MSEAFGLDPGDTGDEDAFSWGFPGSAAFAGIQRENELPVSVAFPVVLARTDDVVVAFTGALVGSTSARLDMVVRVRRAGDLPDHDLASVEPDLALGVQYPDGRRAASVPARWPAVAFGQVVLARQTAMMLGGGRELFLPWSLSPVPPAGPIRFHMRWPALGIAELSVAADAAPLAAAQLAVQTLWPVQHEDLHLSQDEPHAPDLGDDSWFGWTLVPGDA